MGRAQLKGPNGVGPNGYSGGPKWDGPNWNATLFRCITTATLPYLYLDMYDLQIHCTFVDNADDRKIN